MRDRLRTAQLHVVTPAGPIAAGTPVRYELERHACRLGLNIHHWGLLPAVLQSSLEQAVSGLVNTVTVPFYWGQSAYDRLPPYEPAPGRPDRDRLYAMARWAVDQGLRVKGHPLVFYREPPWLAALPAEHQESAYEDRIRREIAGFAGTIDSWEVVNEPTCWSQTCGRAGAVALDGWNRRSGPVEIIRRAHETARSANPRAELILNECQENDAFCDIVRQCRDHGVPLDGIGIQCHEIEVLRTPERLTAMLDRFAAFGLPLHITEIVIPSGGDELRRSFQWQDRPAWVTTPAGEERQAQEAVELYRRLFAHPAVTAITWWDACDSHACLHIPCGLLRGDGSPKPVYQALHRLIHEEWRSAGTTVTDPGGHVRIEGFAGGYVVEAEHGGRRWCGRVTLPDQPAGPVRVELR
jgi:GH35 family endo-1,4-beta-xylanase